MNNYIRKIAEATAEAFMFFVGVLLSNIILLSLIAGMVYFHYHNIIVQIFDAIRTSN